MHHMLRTVFCSLPLVFMAPMLSAQVDPLEAAVGQLRRASTVQRDGEHTHLLRSLRSMNDRTLNPFFTRLSEQDDMLIRVNGILGLAEISDDRRIDPFLIRRLDSELERLQALEQAVLFDLIGVDEIRTMLAWDDLQETSRFTLLGELIKRGEPVDVEDLRQLVESERETMRASASMLLVQVSGEREHFEKERSNIAALGDRERNQAYLWLLNDIGRYRLDRMVWWIDEVINEPGLDYRVVLAGVAAAITADLNRGLVIWQRRAQADRSHANLVRLGLVLFAMASEHDIPAETFETLRDGEPLTEAMAGVGIALARDSNAQAAEAIIRLVNLDHWQSSNHALFVAARLDPPQRSAVYQHYIRHVRESTVRPDDRVSLAIRATPALLEVDVEAVRTLLSEVEPGSRMQEALLMGLLASDSVHAAELARSVPRRGLTRADAFILLLIARDAPVGTLNPDEFRQLGMVAAGGGQVGRAYQVQAAWLYLKHAGRIEYAIGRLFTRRGG